MTLLDLEHWTQLPSPVMMVDVEDDQDDGDCVLSRLQHCLVLGLVESDSVSWCRPGTAYNIGFTCTSPLTPALVPWTMADIGTIITYNFNIIVSSFI